MSRTKTAPPAPRVSPGQYCIASALTANEFAEAIDAILLAANPTTPKGNYVVPAELVRRLHDAYVALRGETGSATFSLDAPSQKGDIPLRADEVLFAAATLNAVGEASDRAIQTAGTVIGDLGLVVLRSDAYRDLWNAYGRLWTEATGRPDLPLW